MWLEEGEQPEEEPSQIDRMLIFDRKVDLITPLVTQLTYEGLIDEAFGISNSKFFCYVFYPILMDGYLGTL